MQWRYDLIRPLLLFEEGTPTQRAQQTQTHPDTVRTFVRKVQHQGMRGLVLHDVEVVQRGRTSRVPERVRQEIGRLKALDNGFHSRELARIIRYRCADAMDDKTAKALWIHSPGAEPLDPWTYQTHPGRIQARLHVVNFYCQGWNKLSISRFLQVSRPTVDR